MCSQYKQPSIATKQWVDNMLIVIRLISYVIARRTPRACTPNAARTRVERRARARRTARAAVAMRFQRDCYAIAE